MIADELGVFLVKKARDAVTRHLAGLKPTVALPDGLSLPDTPHGLFVTIELASEAKGEKRLRGCIGYPQAETNLLRTTISAAIAAATEDIRFPPLVSSELPRVVFEVTVLGPLERLRASSPREIPPQIKMGTHGLEVEKGLFKGILLPQVAVEWSWGPEEFLSQTCMKAGLYPDAWLDPETIIYRFVGEVFHEVVPNGSVSRKRVN